MPQVPRNRKAREPDWAPSPLFDALERKSQTELDLTHRASTFDIGDLSIVATAIDTLSTAAFVLTEGVDGMVEDVESIHPELRFHTFSQFEVLGNRNVIGKMPRPRQRIALGPALSTARR